MGTPGRGRRPRLYFHVNVFYFPLCPVIFPTDMRPSLAHGSTSGFSLAADSRGPGRGVPCSWVTCEGREDVVPSQEGGARKGP